MSTDPSFEELPAHIMSHHTQGLEALAQREAQPMIPNHYAQSLSELRAQQRVPQQRTAPIQKAEVVQQRTAPVQALDIELDGDIESITTVTELCTRVSDMLIRIAQQVDEINGAQLESLGRRLASIQIHPQGELAVIYARAQRAEGKSWNSIADSLNQMMLENEVYKPLRSSSWNGRSLKSLVHLRGAGK